jgi:MFS family permease
MLAIAGLSLLLLHLGVPEGAALALLEHMKGFAALAIAAAFLVAILGQLALSARRGAAVRRAAGAHQAGDALALGLVKPVFFAGVFIEHLTYPFLPQFMHEVAVGSGYRGSAASLPFTAYYLMFALSLVPAGHLAERCGERALMWGGLLLGGAGLAFLALPLDFPLVVLARALCGIGQGVLFIGVQSYILVVAPPGKQTRGAAIIVWGFQGGMIAGMALGSPLVARLGPGGVFGLGGAIALLLAAYSATLLPAAPRAARAHEKFGLSLRRLARDMGEVVRDAEFLRAILLIGIPAKAVMTGIVVFALPLLLARLGFAQDDIGQILMVYALGVLVASTLVSRRVDRSGNTEKVLFCGTVLSGVGLVLAGAIGWDHGPGGVQATLLLVSGVLVVGIAHGFINAPVVTHIAQSALAARVGAGAATAAYRFLERIGHVAGPIVVGQLFLLAGERTLVVSWIGLALLLSALLFLLRWPRLPGEPSRTVGSNAGG